MANDDHQDRRRAERIPINTEFAAVPSAVYISDLSEYGVFVHTDTPSPLGTKLKLRFTVLLDDPVIVEGEGRVVRHQEDPSPGMGIEFTELSPEMILRVNDVLARQRPRDSGPPLPAAEGLGSLAYDSDDGEGEHEDPLDTAATLMLGRAASELVRPPPPSASSSGVFRPPPMPGGGASEEAKTGIYEPVSAAMDDSDSEQ